MAALAIALSVSMSAVVACSGASGSPLDADGGNVGDATTLPDAPAVDAAADVARDAASDATVDAPSDAGPPLLVALSVTASPSADASSPVGLVPAFSPDIHDYTVRCGAVTNLLTVTMTASEGSSSLLVQPDPSPALPQQTLLVNVTENQAVVAAATNATATVEYWVRCLPHDFPLVQWTPHPEAGAPPPGYYLIGTGLPTTSGCYAMALDGNGVPVWYTPAQPTDGWCVFDVDNVVNGAISYYSLIDTPTEFEIHQLDPLATRTISPTGLVTDLHELRLLANGDYLVISTPLQSGVDLTGMHVALPDGGVETVSGQQQIMACNLVEFQPDGTVVWTWTATDHFDAVADSVYPALAAYGPSGTTYAIDPFHCNAVDVDPSNGSLLVSARQMDSVFYVERSTGQVLWKMGGSPASKDGATYVSVADPFALQHDARLQPDWSSACNGGSGHISLFDDEIVGASLPARAVVYDVVTGAGDGGIATDGGCGDSGTAAGTATVAWQWAGQGPSTAMGSFRILPDGSRVIGWGLVPGDGFTEVDLAGNDLADLTFGDHNTTYRAIKVPLSAFDLDVLRRTAGLP
jgi:Arylsulfotransferase (ASST)